MDQRAEQMKAVIDGPAVRTCWEALLAAPLWSGPPLWLHGDLHPANLLVRDGRLCGVIDFGDITAGDPATDLAVAWMLFPPEVRPMFRSAAGGADDDTWTRARGWALSLGLAYLANSADNPMLARIGPSHGAATTRTMPSCVSPARRHSRRNAPSRQRRGTTTVTAPLSASERSLPRFSGST
jgi:hypothetical protein